LALCQKNLTAVRVTATDLEILKEAIRLSASSYGLQLLQIIIEDADLRAKLLPASFGQTLY
jgi:hypothetical protein